MFYFFQIKGLHCFLYTLASNSFYSLNVCCSWLIICSYGKYFIPYSFFSITGLPAAVSFNSCINAYKIVTFIIALFPFQPTNQSAQLQCQKITSPVRNPGRRTQRSCLAAHALVPPVIITSSSSTCPTPSRAYTG